MWRRSRSPAGPPRRARTFSVVAPSDLFRSHIECPRLGLEPCPRLACLLALRSHQDAAPATGFAPGLRLNLVACSRAGSGAERRACPQVLARFAAIPTTGSARLGIGGGRLDDAL